MTRNSRTRHTDLHRILLVLSVAVVLSLAAWIVIPHSADARPGGGVAPLVLGPQADGTSVTLHQGQELRIELEENPSTGYTWHVLKQNPLKLVRKEFLRPAEQMPGAPGKALFVFKALAPGQALVELAYFRSWEGSQKAAGRYRLTVRIR